MGREVRAIFEVVEGDGDGDGGGGTVRVRKRCLVTMLGELE